MAIRSKIIAATLVAASMACSKSEDAPKADTGTGTNTGTGGGGKMQALNLSGALQIQLPEALTDTSTSLRLTAGKSLEACMMRESIKQSKMMLDGITSTLCYIESQSSQIEEGKPKLFKLAGMGLRLQEPPPGFPGGSGPPSGGPGDGPPTGGDPTGGGAPPAGGPGMGGDQYIGVMLQRTGDVTDVYICEGTDAAALKLGQHFKITGNKTITKDGKEVGASKGEMRLSSDMMGINFGAVVTFDAFHTAADTYDSEFKVRLEGEMTGMGLSGMTMDMAQLMTLRVVDGGVSVVGLSDRGDMMGFSTQNASIGKFDAAHGNVVGSFNQQSFDRDVKACVDKDSTLVSCADAKFEEGGALHIATSEVPAFLPASFAPAKPAGFDCATATWGTAVAIDPSGAGAAACQMEQGDMEAPGCFEGGFVGSEEVVELPEIPELEIPEDQLEVPAP